MPAGMSVAALVGLDQPLLAVAFDDTDLDQAAHDLLEEQRISPGALEDAVAEVARTICSTARRTVPPAAFARH